jgi:hypothetical protein
MRVLYKLWRPTWSQHIKWSVLQRSPDFWCSPRVLKLCPHKYGAMVVYALHETNGPQFPASTRASSTHKNYQHAPSYSCEYSKSMLLRISLRRTPCQCQWDRGTILFMHEMPLSGSQALTAQLVELLEQSLQRIGRVPPAQNLVLSIVSWKVMWSSQENTLSQVTRTQYKV